ASTISANPADRPVTGRRSAYRIRSPDEKPAGCRNPGGDRLWAIARYDRRALRRRYGSAAIRINVVTEESNDADEDTQSGPEFVSASDSAAQPVRRVVVAEDEAVIRLDIVEMLREVGYDVVGEADD